MDTVELKVWLKCRLCQKPLFTNYYCNYFSKTVFCLCL